MKERINTSNVFKQRNQVIWNLKFHTETAAIFSKTNKTLKFTIPIGNNGENNSFKTLNDHKENFINNPTVRLINPAKNKFGRISKAILNTANENIREALTLNQWRNTDTVINWFKGIHNKHFYKFVIFDIKEFYLSMTDNLLKKP